MSRKASLLLSLGIWLLMAVFRVTVPSTLADKDQPKIASYTLDIVDRGQWVLQYNSDGEVATKPPLYQWVVGGLALATGRLNDWILISPALLSGLVILLIVWSWAGRMGTRAAEVGYWSRCAPEPGGNGAGAEADLPDARDSPHSLGNELAFLAAVVWTLTYHVQRLQWTARTDSMVAAMGLGAIAAAWKLGQANSPGAKAFWRWTFWGVLALGMLTKGVVAPAVALGAVGMECLARRTTRPLLDLWPWFGLPLISLVFLLWFNAAWMRGGEVFWNTLIGEEMVHHVTGTRERAHNTRPVYYFLPVFVGRFLPWSVLLLLALPRWWKEKLWRRDHPFLAPAAWTLGILLVFSIPRGKRPDHIFPIYAPAAVLAAVVLMEWIRSGWGAFGWKLKPALLAALPRGDALRRRRAWKALAAITAASIIAAFHFLIEPAQTRIGEQTRRFGTQAAAIIARSPAEVHYCEVRNSLVHFYLRTHSPSLTLPELIEKLETEAAAPRRGEKFRAWIILPFSSAERLQSRLSNHPYLRVREVLRVDAAEKEMEALTLALAENRVHSAAPASPRHPASRE
jgi:4-amino-4-deoxy-L-arabinose transferase-like glycosyltransferase